ncbi:MAG: PilZ domain-containing protein [Deltaproteobacteria bacterium]|nr:PilZ domain-containing protein [Deltaproteobacteria bacterium]
MTADRQFPRYALEAELVINTRGAGAARRGRTSNLSRGGLCALIDEPVDAGRSVDIEIALVFDQGNTSESLTLPARVVWCTALGSRYQIGVAFHGLLAGQREYLELFLRFLAEGAQRQRPDAPVADDDPFA